MNAPERARLLGTSNGTFIGATKNPAQSGTITGDNSSGHRIDLSGIDFECD